MKALWFSVAALFFVLGPTIGSASAQETDLCSCAVARIDANGKTTTECPEIKSLSDEETIKIIDCFLNQKGNKKPVWGVVVSDTVSQTFGPSPLEVVALFDISALFYQGKFFASAKVLVLDDDDNKLNTRKAIAVAHKAYRKWFEKVKIIGLQEARRQGLDPLAGTDVSWYGG